MRYDSGAVTPGNIDIYNRPVVRNNDGSISTVATISFQGDDGYETLVPTISNTGQRLTDQQAIDNYYKTGEHLGKFNSPDAATLAGESLHKMQEAYYANPNRQGVNMPANNQQYLDPVQLVGYPSNYAHAVNGVVYGAPQMRFMGGQGMASDWSQQQADAAAFANNLMSMLMRGGQRSAQAQAAAPQPVAQPAPQVAPAAPMAMLPAHTPGVPMMPGVAPAHTTQALPAPQMFTPIIPTAAGAASLAGKKKSALTDMLFPPLSPDQRPPAPPAGATVPMVPNADMVNLQDYTAPGYNPAFPSGESILQATMMRALAEAMPIIEAGNAPDASWLDKLRAGWVQTQLPQMMLMRSMGNSAENLATRGGQFMQNNIPQNAPTAVPLPIIPGGAPIMIP